MVLLITIDRILMSSLQVGIADMETLMAISVERAGGDRSRALTPRREMCDRRPSDAALPPATTPS